jgi:hypothetical protein
MAGGQGQGQGQHAGARIDAECQCPRAIDSLTLDSLGSRYTSALQEPANESLIVSPILPLDTLYLSTFQGYLNKGDLLVPLDSTGFKLLRCSEEILRSGPVWGV